MTNNTKQVKWIGLLLVGLAFGWIAQPVLGAPPIFTDESSEEKKEGEKDEKSEDREKESKEEKALKKTLGKMRKKLAAGEKKLRVRANIFRSNVEITECTGADKARSRLNDIGDEGGLVIKGQLSISASNEANIEKNEGSINNQTSVSITNEYYKRC